jgi:ribosome-binding ATPase YchF (GTP1/OBG family)
VVRCFTDENIVHIDGSVDPKRDIEIMQPDMARGFIGGVSPKFIFGETATWSN